MSFSVIDRHCAFFADRPGQVSCYDQSSGKPADYFAAVRCEVFCDRRVSVSVCLSARVFHKQHVQISPNFMYLLGLYL